MGSSQPLYTTILLLPEYNGACKKNMSEATLEKSCPGEGEKVHIEVDGQDGQDKSHHVHFSEDTDVMGNTAIVVKEKAKEILEAHVGFLQILHRYRITIKLPLEDADEGYQIGETHGVYCHADSLLAVEGGLEVSLDLMAHKEKLLRETVTLKRPSGGKLKLMVLARVLGKGKGTPMLREGITCVGVEHDEESEGSDWQGFS